MTLLLKVTYIPKLSALTSTLVFQTFHAFWHIDQHQQWNQIGMYVLKNNCCIFGMVKIIFRYNFALPLYYIDEESCSNLPSKPISTWGTSIPNFFQGIICVCKYNGKSVLEKKCSTAFLWQKSGCDRQQLDENFFSPFWVVCIIDDDFSNFRSCILCSGRRSNLGYARHSSEIRFSYLMKWPSEML